MVYILSCVGNRRVLKLAGLRQLKEGVVGPILF